MGLLVITFALALLELSETKSLYTQVIYHDEGDRITSSFSCNYYDCNEGISICSRARYTSGYYLEKTGLNTAGLCRTDTTKCCGKMDKFSDNIILRSTSIRRVDDIFINECNRWILRRHVKMTIKTTPIDTKDMDSRSLRKGTYDQFILSAESLEVCVHKNGEYDSKIIVKCIDGILTSSEKNCKLWIDHTEFEFTDCTSRQLPLYTDVVNVAFNDVYRSVKCEATNICSMYDRMDFWLRLKHWDCNKGFVWFLYSGIALIIITIIFTIIGLIKYYLIIVPTNFVFRIMKKLIPNPFKLLKRRRSDYNAHELVRVKQDELSNLTDENVKDVDSDKGKTLPTRYRMRDGTYLTVGIILVFLPLVLGSCRDGVDSITSLSTCNSYACRSVTTINLKFRSMGDETCLSFKDANLKIRVLGISMRCNSRVIYYTRKYKYVITRDDYKCFTGPDCSLNPSKSIWDDEEQYLHHDYCKYENVGVFSCGVPFIRSSHWQRMKVESGDKLICSAEECQEFQPYIVLVITMGTNQTIAEISSSVYKGNGYTMTLDSTTPVLLPTKFVRCGSELFKVNFNDLGDLSDDHYGSLQCPDHDSAYELSKKCEIKYQHIYEHTSNIMVDSGDSKLTGTNTTNNDLEHLEPLFGGYQISTDQMWPITIQIKTLKELVQEHESDFVGSISKCSIKGVSRLIGGAIINLYIESERIGWGLLTCEDLSSFRFNVEGLGFQKFSKHISVYTHTSSDVRVNCNMTTGRGVRRVVCETSLREHTIEVSSDKNNIENGMVQFRSDQPLVKFLIEFVEDNPKTSIVSASVVIMYVSRILIGNVNNK
uniref:Membrane protein n=1 Tax=Tenuivirus oryzabrevis TaxID=3052762 RepID=A0A0R5NFW2_9VIRU|nr:membrane protein [Tenuivirus oryzabrevis]